MDLCLNASASCAAGHGRCGAIGGYCICTDPNYEDMGDMKRSTSCAVHVPTFKVLWAMTMAMFASDILLGLAAVMWMKRKRRQAERAELFTTWFLILISMFGLAFAALEFSPTTSVEGDVHSRRIGVDGATSIVFALYAMATFTSGLIKPISRSEVSIARFALERTNRGLLNKYYSKLVTILLGVLSISCFAPVVGAYKPHLEAQMIHVYGVSFLILFKVGKA